MLKATELSMWFSFFYIFLPLGLWRFLWLQVSFCSQKTRRYFFHSRLVSNRKLVFSSLAAKIFRVNCWKYNDTHTLFQFYRSFCFFLCKSILAFMQQFIFPKPYEYSCIVFSVVGGCDPNQQVVKAKGKTAMHAAAGGGYVDIMACLRLVNIW